MLLTVLLILLLCTLIGYLVGHPGAGLAVGAVVILVLLWAHSPHTHV